jgi:5'-phosphate synthase pdxT subunit
MKIGVLAIQGDFGLHQKALAKIRINSKLVKYERDLTNCDGLIIPGGESTTLNKLIQINKLRDPLINFGLNKVIMGTCAGLIMLSKEVDDPNIDTLKLLNITISRNAYGRQINSFIDNILLQINGKNMDFEGVFIRAPKITKVGEGIKIRGYHKDNAVFVENTKILGTTFHPELTNNLFIHKYFIEKINNI